MRISGNILICTFALGLVSAAASAADTTGLFDEPSEVKIIPLAADPLNPQAKPQLSCFYYRDFMVKQIDRGEKGAEQLSILAIAGGPAKPECHEANASNEKVIDANDWGGYFKGVKGNYVFFDADDGRNGGVGFAIFNATDGRKIFEDSTSAFHSIGLTASGLILRYKRVYSASCSLIAEHSSCWDKVKPDTGLTASAPDCTASYKLEQERSGMKAEELAPDPSVIDYEAETTVDGDHTKIAPVSNESACRPAN